MATPNTYVKFCPNVYIALCHEEYKKGDEIAVETKYGKENICTVFNLIGSKEGRFYYSIVRSDGFNAQQRAANKVEKLTNAATNAEARSDKFYIASHKDRDFLSLAEPIKIGHHSEKRHRKAIESVNNNMRKCVEASNDAESFENRKGYWEAKQNEINLSMPESIEFYKFKVEQATAKHEGLKNGTIKREHSFSLTYAKKDLNEAKKNLETSIKLWA